MTKIFVYGTLKRGQCRAHVLSSSRFLGSSKTEPFYRLYSVQGMYPALVEAARDDVCRPGVSVKGEVYEVTADVLGQLDEIEGVEMGLYERRPLEVLGAHGDIEAYFWCGGVESLTGLGDSW